MAHNTRIYTVKLQNNTVKLQNKDIFQGFVPLIFTLICASLEPSRHVCFLAPLLPVYKPWICVRDCRAKKYLVHLKIEK